METCLWKGRQIVAYDPKNEYGQWDYNLKEAYVEAGQNRELTCEECGSPVYFRPGVKKEPHFAHYSDCDRQCLLERHGESEEHLAGKRALYHYFKRMYPTASIRLNYLHNFHRRSDLFIIFESGEKLVVEYQCKDIHVRQWKQKHQDYLENDMAALWVLSMRQYYRPEIENRFFADLVAHRGLEQTLIMLSPSAHEFALVRQLQLLDENRKIVGSSRVGYRYPIASVVVRPNGLIQQDEFENQVTIEYGLMRERIKLRNQETKKKEAPQSGPKTPVNTGFTTPRVIAKARTLNSYAEIDVPTILSRLRQDHPDNAELDCLMKPDGRMELEEVWARKREEDPLWLNLKRVLKMKEIPAYLKQDIRGALMFKCDKSLWQGAILAALVSGQTKARTIKDLSRWVRKMSSIPLFSTISDAPVKGLPTIGEVIFIFFQGLEQAGLISFTDSLAIPFRSFRVHWKGELPHIG